MNRQRLTHFAIATLVGLASTALQAQERPPREGPPRGQQPPREGAQRYSIEQAVSDRAQLHTIAFDALAFLTGDFGYDTFLPPGKVSDYFGFQYMRDIDARSGGHNTSFLTRIAHNMLATLNDAQRAQLVKLANEQVPDIRKYAEMRLPLIMAFRRNLENDLPRGSKGLSQKAVTQHSADLYALDGALAFGATSTSGVDRTVAATTCLLNVGQVGSYRSTN